MRLRAHCSAVN